MQAYRWGLIIICKNKPQAGNLSAVPIGSERWVCMPTGGFTFQSTSGGSEMAEELQSVDRRSVEEMR